MFCNALQSKEAFGWCTTNIKFLYTASVEDLATNYHENVARTFFAITIRYVRFRFNCIQVKKWKRWSSLLIYRTRVSCSSENSKHHLITRSWMIIWLIIDYPFFVIVKWKAQTKESLNTQIARGSNCADCRITLSPLSQNFFLQTKHKKRQKYYKKRSCE